MSETGEYPVVCRLETVHPVKDYPDHQLMLAMQIALTLERGLFVLCRPPE